MWVDVGGLKIKHHNEGPNATYVSPNPNPLLLLAPGLIGEKLGSRDAGVIFEFFSSKTSPSTTPWTSPCMFGNAENRVNFAAPYHVQMCCFYRIFLHQTLREAILYSVI